MLTEFLDRILELNREETVDIDDKIFTTKKLHIPPQPQPEPLAINTLKGLVDYIKADNESFTFEGFFVHVETHNLVKFCGPIIGHDDSRMTLIKAEFSNECLFNFGQKYDPEKFVIELQASFVDNNDSRKMLQMVGNITNERVVSSEDDGITQKVGLKTGAKLNMQGQESLPNPVTLKPYRTFLEIDQPESTFVFRVHQSAEGELPRCALYEADGGFWKNEAIAEIKRYLEAHLPEIPIIA